MTTSFTGRPAPQSRVRLSETNGDSIPIGRTRVRLKLAAVGYSAAHQARDQALVLAGSSVLAESALRYVEALLHMTAGEIPVPAPHHLASDDFANVKFAALAYASIRNGSDANLESARAGMGVLCEAAIRFVEGMSLIPRGKPRPIDPSLHLDSGM